ncbi:MAG: methylated-DNA--[protein]-cysteine S-methyltransferase [Polyangiales bacterium]
MASPLGPLVLRASSLGLTGVAMQTLSPLGDEPNVSTLEAVAVISLAEEQLTEYFDGRRTDFTVPLHLEGSAFQRAVWHALLTVPFGQTASYGAIARKLGRPTAARAVGAANRRNAVAVFVPCHRIVGSDGSLTGYAGGMTRKHWLLDHERAHLPS